MVNDTEILKHDPTYTYHKTHNHYQTMDVKKNGITIGWIDSRTLGFNKVKDYEHNK